MEPKSSTSAAETRASYSRRTVLAAMMSCGCQLVVRPAHARSLSDTAGCVLLEEDYHLIAGRDVTVGKSISAVRASGIRRTTGYVELDRAFDVALKRLADTFGVFPGFGFYNDGDSPNAISTTKTLVQGTDGTVLFGNRLFARLMKFDPTGGAVMWTAAHEFAHIWLYFEGGRDRLLEGQTTVKRVELHADFLAGFYLGQRKRSNESITLYHAGKDIWASGDTAFNNPNHHGTPEERIAAAEAGFKASFEENLSAREAFALATEYVLRR